MRIVAPAEASVSARVRENPESAIGIRIAMPGTEDSTKREMPGIIDVHHHISAVSGNHQGTNHWILTYYD
jgi:hypothetical protein